MDEAAFRRTQGAANPQPCAFEKAILISCGACSLADRRHIAEREAVACVSAPAREQCEALRVLLRQNSVFALKLTQIGAPLPHAQEMKVQCGGLQGVMQAVGLAGAVGDSAAAPSSGGEGLPRVADVHGLVRTCSDRFGGLQNLPYSAIVQSVVAYQIRRRRLPQ
jgi:hypothetical protein